MSLAEFITVVLCLFVGYGIASRLMNGSSEESGKDSRKVDAERQQQDAQDEPERKPEGRERNAGFVADRPWHVVLGVSENAGREQIIAAYKLRISEYHPDKVTKMGADIRELAEARSKEINAAYTEGLTVAATKGLRA